MGRTARVPTLTPASPLAAAIVGRMRELGLTQARLGERLAAAGVHKAQSSRLLTGDTQNPSLVTVLALCRALRLDPTALARRASLWGTQEAFGETVDAEPTAIPAAQLERGG